MKHAESILRIFSYLVSVALLCVNINQCFADFLSINPLVKHVNSSTDGSAGVVILPSSSANVYATGLLFYSSSRSHSAQGFNPNILTAGEADSVFLKFDPQLHQFTELVISGGKTVQINGSIALKLGGLKISVESTKPGFDPYVSVTFKDHSVLALLGLQVVFNGHGEELVNILDSGNLSDSETLTIKNQNLFLNNEKFEGSKIGLLGNSSDDSLCLSMDAVIASKNQISEILSGKNSSLTEKIKLNRKNDFYQKNTFLRASKDRILVLDGYGQIFAVTPLSQRVFDSRPACVVTPVMQENVK